MKIKPVKFWVLPFYFWGFVAQAQQIEYPIITKNTDNIDNCIPAQWKLITKVEGDLNKDGASDFVMVIQQIDTKMIIDERDENPRILLVFFKDNATKKYNLILQSNSFIPRNDLENMDDRFGNISIKNGILNIQLHYFCNSGCWEMSDPLYKFRFQNNQFELIGYESETTHRGSGEITSYSINFSTKTMEIGKGNIQSDKMKTTTKKIALPKLKTFETLKEPQSWEFMGCQI